MIFRVKIQPNAKKNKIVEKIKIDDQEYFKIKIKAPAVDNKANQELISFLSQNFNIPQKNIKILKGEKNSLKVLNFEDFESL
jgi:hypothetical protein